MEKAKRYILTLSMLLPMLVMMAHDIIPHHNSLHLLECPSDQNSGNCCNNEENNHIDIECSPLINCKIDNSHKSSNKSCCHSTHHRLQQDLKFQIILNGELILFDVNEYDVKIRHLVWDEILITDTLWSSPSLRAPPALLI